MLCPQGPIEYAGMMGCRLDPTLMIISLITVGREIPAGGSSLDDKNVGDDSFGRAASFSLRRRETRAVHESTKATRQLLYFWIGSA